jgi:hypothetical protein
MDMNARATKTIVKKTTRFLPLKVTKMFSPVVVLCLAGISCNASNLTLVSRPTTDQSTLAIVKNKNDDYFFMDTKTNQKLGYVHGELHGARINHVEASWSPDARTVAVLISYGTRLSTILLYSLGDHREIKSVQLPDVDPIAIYDPDKKFLHLGEQASGYSENALGTWMTNDSLKIVRGNAVIDPETDEHTRHYLIVLDLKIVGHSAQIANQFLPGVLSNEQARRFLREWKH